VDQQRRWLLFVAITCIVYILFYVVYLLPYQKAAEKQRKQQRELTQQATSQTLAATTGATTTTTTLEAERRTTASLIAAPERPSIPTTGARETSLTVQTQLYRVTFASRGGRPTSWQYFDQVPGQTGAEVIELIPQRAESPQRELPLEVIVKELNKIEYPEFNTTVYESQVKHLDDGSTEVVFTSPKIQNLQIVKTYHFHPDRYLTQLQVVLRNLSPQADCRINDDEHGLGLSWGPGVRQYPPDEQPNTGFINIVWGTPARAGYAAISKPGQERPERGEITWAGVNDKFFLAAMIPDRARATTGTAVDCLLRLKNVYSKEELEKAPSFHSPPFTVILYNNKFEIPPREQVALNYQLFVGPKRPELMRELSKASHSNLTEVLFYSSSFRWMRGLKLGLMDTLNWLDSKIHNYGVAIVILTVLIRILMHPLAHKGMKMQAKTMAEMQKIKPLLDEANRKYKNDMAKRNQETMRLYKEHNISPLAPLRGCLPMVIQIPIFFALYSLLNESIDLRGASFLWIKDLAGPDKLVDLAKLGMAFQIPIVGWHVAAVNLLPILMGASQQLMSMLTPTPTRDASQKQMMMIFSIMFPVMLYNFPSGLFIYWLINNVWQSVHQLIANRLIRKPTGGEAATTTS